MFSVIIFHFPSELLCSFCPALTSSIFVDFSQAAEFFFFAALMAVTTLIFAIMSYFYRYVNTSGNYIDLDVPDSDTKNFAASPSPMAYDNRAVDEN